MFITKRETSVLKGIGILSVILSHTSIMCSTMGVKVTLLENEAACMAICEAGMSLFLFLSGYGLHKSYTIKGLNGYIKGKLINVLIPYMLVQLISMTAHILKRGVHGGLLFNLSQLFGINPTNIYDPSMWYISYIFFWYVVFYIAYKTGKGSYISLIMIGIAALAGFIYVPRYWGNNADYCVMTFFLGVLTAYVTDKDREVPGDHNKVVRAMTIILLAAGGYTLMIPFHRMNILTENLGAFLGMTAFILLVKLLRGVYEFRVFYFAGTVSFWLYLLEWKLIIKNGIYDVWGCNFLTYIFCFAGTIALSYLCTKFYDMIRNKVMDHQGYKGE